jgi:hypothetical protein
MEECKIPNPVILSEAKNPAGGSLLCNATELQLDVRLALLAELRFAQNDNI